MVFCALETYLYPHTVLLKRGAAQHCAPVRRRFGGGAAHRYQESRSPYVQERKQASNQTRRGRAKRLCAQERSQTQEVPPGRALSSGSTQCDPVRPQARPLRSLSHGETCPYRRPSRVLTYNKPPGRACGPRRSTLCPCRVFSLSGSDTFGPQDYCGEIGPLLPRRPT